MHTKQFRAYEGEMAAARTRFQQGDWEGARHHLERAHILGQKYLVTHVPVHWWMWKLGRATGDRREGFAQVWRMMLAVPESLLKVLPHGNPGSGRVSAFRKFPIDEDLVEAMKRSAPPGLESDP